MYKSKIKTITPEEEIISHFVDFLPTIKVSTADSEKPRYYKPGKGRFIEWLKNQGDINNISFNTLPDNAKKDLYDIIFKPVKYRNLTFYSLGGGYEKSNWGVYNGTDQDIKEIEICEEEIIGNSNTYSQKHTVKYSVLKNKEYKYYAKYVKFLLSDGTYISLEHDLGVFAQLLADPLYLEANGNVNFENKDFSIIKSEGANELNNIINYQNHFEQLDLLTKTYIKNSQIDKLIKDKTITINLELANFQDFKFVNKARSFYSALFINSILFCFEQLFIDYFSAARGNKNTSTRRVIRLGSKIIFGIDVHTINYQQVCEKINEFIDVCNSICKSIYGSETEKSLNPYFQTLIKNIKKIKIDTKQVLIPTYFISILPIEEKTLLTPYQYRILNNRQPDFDIIPNTACLAINEVMSKDVAVKNFNNLHIFIEYNCLFILKGEINKKCTMQSSDYISKSGRIKDLVVRYYNFNTNII